eukprot:CAMPEP_0201591126 /NCGR_PEP_ID=MMETSP0190_2-20130828/185788_1 /ASSEMBLY_ACC=CAM_ASM_000263 /TAXON_ID=37353 /ORGANISM="Rosalina sp." /LENGTH=171 /DNA_ID=CAMNT_0048048741 /DNA_START=27 /DNA_END=542 /DNA_ORIENTATION=+
MWSLPKLLRPSRRFYSSIAAPNTPYPRLVRIATGEMVTLPENSSLPVVPSSIVSYGLDSIIFDDDPQNAMEENTQLNREAYVTFRKNLGTVLDGKWIGMLNGGGITIVDSSEDGVAKQAKVMVMSGVAKPGLYVNCMNREIGRLHWMNSFDEANEEEIEEEIEKPADEKID